MVGMSRTTGQSIGRRDHILQSIADILTTPIGSRVIRREYGSHLPSLIDRPTNSKTIVQIYAATLDPLARWEPRVSVSSVAMTVDADGKGVLTITATDTATGETLTTSVGVTA